MATPKNLDMRALRELTRDLAKLDGMHVKVGVVGAAALEEVEPGFNRATLAAVHEFGSPANNIPERSFIRLTFENGRERLREATEKVARAVIVGKITKRKALEILGHTAATMIKNTITVGRQITPPLKQATIDRKKSDRPLVDTGGLLNSISHIVVEGDA